MMINILIGTILLFSIINIAYQVGFNDGVREGIRRDLWKQKDT